MTRQSRVTIIPWHKNPRKLSLQGTNRYVIGTSNPYILVDTGQGKLDYPPFLRTVLGSPQHPSLPDISDIILAHRHIDHVYGVPSVLSLCRELWAKRNPRKVVRSSAHTQSSPFLRLSTTPSLTSSCPSCARATTPPHREAGLFHDLADSQTLIPSVLPPGSDTRDWELQVLQCPGHTVDSISLVFPADRSLFTGDSVLGQGTAAFEDLGDYLASLQKMLDASDKYETINPGHGPVVPDGPKTIRMYIDHRLENPVNCGDGRIGCAAFS